jgi:single-stranded-DNA-specific exonuclease
MRDLSVVRAFLDPHSYIPVPAGELPGVSEAAERILGAIARQEQICVWGDFDVDGQTATTVFVSALRKLGAKIFYHIPVRASESHGIRLPVLTKLLNQPGVPVHLLLTCDTGIAAHEAVDYARQRGVDVVITDHHELPEILPQANAIVNPHLLPENHALSALPGVGVVYKLVEEIFRQKGQVEAAEEYVDLVALGIIADVALLHGENRPLVQRGLSSMRGEIPAATPRLGLQILLEIAEVNPAYLTEEHLAFVLAPRLNAIGRLSDANPAVELLTTADENRARTLAYYLEGLNSQRQLLTSQVYQAALAQIEQDRSLLDYAALVLAHPTWPAGVIGIVASRLVERFQKPVIMVSTPPGGAGRASARSIAGIDITTAIASQADLLLGYGGHRMAAGFSIEPEKLPEFRRRLSRIIENLPAPPEPELVLDGELALGDLTLELSADLERLAPFGPGNPALKFVARSVEMKQHTFVGRNQEHLLLTVEDERGDSRQVIWWQSADQVNTPVGEQAPGIPEGRFDLAFSMRSTTYRGQRDLQLTWVDFRQSQEEIALLPAPRREMVDLRKEDQPFVVLRDLIDREKKNLNVSSFSDLIQIWSEGGQSDDLVQGLRRAFGDQAFDLDLILANRLTLSPCHTLVVWTTPPGRAQFDQVLEICRPERLVLIAFDPELDSMEPFLRRLAGLVKYSLASTSGMIRIDRLAAAMAHRSSTIYAGLEWLVAQGNITVAYPESSQNFIQIMPGKQTTPSSSRLPIDLSNIHLERLKALLEETAAYRAFFRRVSPNLL